MNSLSDISWSKKLNVSTRGANGAGSELGFRLSSDASKVLFAKKSHCRTYQMNKGEMRIHLVCAALVE